MLKIARKQRELPSLLDTPSLQRERRSGTCASHEGTTTSSLSGHPPSLLFFFSPPTTPLSLSTSVVDGYSQTFVGQNQRGHRGMISGQLRGPHPPTQPPSHPDFMSPGLKTLRAFAQYTVSSLHLRYSQSNKYISSPSIRKGVRE